MTQEKLLLMIAKGAIAEMPEEDRKQYEEVKKDLDAMVEKHGDIAIAAMQITALEDAVNGN